jgi:hypothetical protein
MSDTSQTTKLGIVALICCCALSSIGIILSVGLGVFRSKYCKKNDIPYSEWSDDYRNGVIYDINIDAGNPIPGIQGKDNKQLSDMIREKC